LKDDSVWDCLESALDTALKGVITMRTNEGRELKGYMQKQIVNIRGLIDRIEERAPLVVLEYKTRLEERIQELLGGDLEIEQERFNSEVAFFADRSDITEEVIRFRSHIKQFSDSLELKDAIGRRLDFIVQEMNREINTIGSKASDLDICNYVVDVKSELEKIREQIQNIE
ncbi:MAG: YicC family protein, partial [Tissierellia bacterium]|nr:YicC family protein [Tissierellia bacterium]